jgi:hypothetical protein
MRGSTDSLSNISKFKREGDIKEEPPSPAAEKRMAWYKHTKIKMESPESARKQQSNMLMGAPESARKVGDDAAGSGNALGVVPMNLWPEDSLLTTPELPVESRLRTPDSVREVMDANAAQMLVELKEGNNAPWSANGSVMSREDSDSESQAANAAQTLVRLMEDNSAQSTPPASLTSLAPMDLTNEVDSPPRSPGGGSRRSTRRRKYRKTLKNTRRQKIGNQTSRTRSKQRRNLNKKRYTARKN